MNFELSHHIICPAPAERVYALISEPLDWPDILTHCVATRMLASSRTGQTVEMTVSTGSGTATWQSERRLRPEFHGVEEYQRHPMPLVEQIQTSWRVVTLDTDSCVLLAEHSVDITDESTGTPNDTQSPYDAAAHIADMIHRNIELALADYQAAALARCTTTTAGDISDGTIRHVVICEAKAEAVYDVVCDTRIWPQLFDACEDVEIVQEVDDISDVRVYAIQNGRRVSWVTRRVHHRDLRRVDYQLLESMPFVAEMAGQWRVIPLEPGRCLLVVDRWWTMLDDVQGIRDGIESVTQAAEFVRSFVDTNAAAEMRVIANHVRSSGMEAATR
ncbi:SRPBCC family protein [Nocardia salmonicida]|uniref:SRPBCC family protein n=1 Tax=Nocardia salmonicida TaxID=53431 RepID=UPI003444FAF1